MERTARRKQFELIMREDVTAILLVNNLVLIIILLSVLTH